MLGAIEKRRSCRKFDDREVEDEKIMEICKAGLLAPSAMHNENVEIIVIKDSLTKKRLSSLNARIASMPEGKDPFYGASCILLVISKKSRTAIYDGSVCMENMLLEATDLHLGAVWIHRAKEEIESPEGREILSSLGLDLTQYEGIGHVALGYPLQQAEPKTVDLKRIHIMDQERKKPCSK